MFEKIHPGLWMALPKDIKAHLVSVFGIVRTGGSHVVDNEVVSDGYTLQDLSVITLEKMTEYIGSAETFPRAWELTCAKAKYELYPPIPMQPESAEVKEAPVQPPVDNDHIVEGSERFPEPVITETKTTTHATTKKGK